MEKLSFIFVSILTILAVGAEGKNSPLKWRPYLGKKVDDEQVQPSPPPLTNDWIEKVTIVFMNHLDVGYASFINNILNEYFETYFPRAFQICEALKQGGYVENMVYTTHPWLVSLYLDCPPNLVLSGIKLKCPSQQQKDQFLEAVRLGYITWHAGPMNMQLENAESWLIDKGLMISIDLDKRFNITRKMMVLSQRDVPGVPHSVIPLLKNRGISAISVGVNDFSSPPAVPKLFRWQYADSQNEILAHWHPGGYPTTPGTKPSSPGGLSRKDCAFIEGFREALCFYFRTDNYGPPENIQEVLNGYEVFRAEFPNAKLISGTMEDFFFALDKVRDRLPVVSQEIGDNWIQGVASDPAKNVQFRAISRVLGRCFKSGLCDDKDRRVWNATRFLMKAFEHTWGLYSEHDSDNWANPAFHKIQKTKASFIDSANSWIEQRNMTYLALDSLSGHPVLTQIQEELEKVKPTTPNLLDFEKVASWDKTFSCPTAQIKFLQFGKTGSIVRLNANDIEWANMEHQLNAFAYRSFDESDFNAFSSKYDYNQYSAGYYKPNLDKTAHPESKDWFPEIQYFYTNKVRECDFWLKLKMSDNKTVDWYGAPQQIWIRYTARSSSESTKDNPGIDIDFQMFQKTSTRLPEALTINFFPVKQQNYLWTMYKLNSPVDPYNVVLNGSQYLHVLTDEGFTYTHPASNSGLRITSMDIPLLNILDSLKQTQHVFPYPLAPLQADTIRGMGYNIYNNIWETNYIFWYPFVDRDADFRARLGIDILLGDRKKEGVERGRDGEVRNGSSDEGIWKYEDMEWK